MRTQVELQEEALVDMEKRVGERTEISERYGRTG